MTVSEKKSLKRASIIDAAYKLFTDKSIHMTAVDDVVNLAGVAKGTFYLYFRDKYDLLDQLILSKTTEIVLETLATLNNNTYEDTETTSRVIAFTDMLISRLGERKELLALIDKNRSLSLKLFMTNENEKLKAAIDWLLSDCAHRGISQKDAQNMLYVMSDMVIAVCCDSILYERPCPISEIKPLLFSMIKKLI